ncbi:MAG: tetratricopeptide repeat protein, partial [Tumebacillaceae bacterium]
VDPRVGACSRQIPRYLSMRLEELEGVETIFAPYCAESESGDNVFVVSTSKQKAEELQEIGRQYGVDHVVSGMACFDDPMHVVLQVVSVEAGWVHEHHILCKVRNYRASIAEMIQSLRVQLAPECREQGAPISCEELTPCWEAAAAFFCALDRLMALQIGGQEQEPDEMFELFFEALEHDPDWADGLEQLIGAALEYGSEGHRPIGAAVAALERLVLLRTEEPKAWEALGHLYERAGDRPDALICLEQAHDLDPLAFSSYHPLASLYRRFDRLAEAEETLRFGLLRQPEHIPMLNELGVILDDLGRHGEASDCFRRLIDLSPISGVFYANLGVSLSRNGEQERAEEAFNAGMAVLDPHWNLFVNYARFLKDRERWLDYVTVLFQGIQVLEDRRERLDLATRLVEVAREWIGADAPEQVAVKGGTWTLGLFESLVELLPEHRSSWVVLSEIYRQSGRMEKALDCLLRVEPEEQENVWLQLHIGSLLSSLGRQEEAFQRFQQVLDQEAELEGANWRELVEKLSDHEK